MVYDVSEVAQGVEAVYLATEDEVADVVGLFVGGEAEITWDWTGIGVYIGEAVLHLDLLEALDWFKHSFDAFDHYRRGSPFALFVGDQLRHPKVQWGIDDLLGKQISTMLLVNNLQFGRRFILFL